MEAHFISREASLLIVLFVVLYLLVLTRLALKYHLDLVDFFMLATVALVPGGFVLFPGVVKWVCSQLRVELPLVLLFGILMVFIFAFFIRLSRRCYKLESKIREIAQDAALRNVSKS